jgi:hypothetical protein
LRASLRAWPATVRYRRCRREAVGSSRFQATPRKSPRSALHADLVRLAFRKRH